MKDNDEEWPCATFWTISGYYWDWSPEPLCQTMGDDYMESLGFSKKTFDFSQDPGFSFEVFIYYGALNHHFSMVELWLEDELVSTIFVLDHALDAFFATEFFNIAGRFMTICRHG